MAQRPLRFVAIYVRVSTTEQADSGLGLQAQLERARAYVTALGLGEGTAVREYVDAGESAGTTDRPQLQALLADVHARRVAAVVVAKLDRLSRRLADTLDLVATFERRGTAFVSVAETFDTGTPVGRLMLQIVSAFAEFEREEIRHRTKVAMAAIRSNGFRAGTVPYGFTADANGRLVRNEGEQATIELVRELRASGMSQRAIVAECRRRGIVSRFGKALCLSQIGNILRAAS